MNAVLIVGVVVLVGLVVYLAWRADRKRRERLRAYAARMGWSYAPRDDSPLERFAGEPFRSGAERKCRHVLEGRYGDRPSTVFEFEYVTYSTDSQGRRQRHVHHDTVTALGLPRVLPWVQVKRENIVHKIGHALGFDDVELESEDFNRRFRVTAQDRKLAYDVLHPRMMELLLRADGPAWRIESGALLCWANGKLKLDRVQPMLDFAAVVVDNIPRFLWSDP